MPFWKCYYHGFSAHEVNQMYPDLESPFKWQKSYGVLTFEAKNPPFVIDYIQCQKDHHTKGTTQDYLERFDD